MNTERLDREDLAEELIANMSINPDGCDGCWCPFCRFRSICPL
jgi:hypothetical protein